VQVGDAVSAATFYHARIVRGIGFGKIAGALSQERTHLEVLRPKVVSATRTVPGVEVVVIAENIVGGTRQPKAEIFSFLLIPTHEGWRVIYDTLLSTALPAYVYSRVQERVAPDSRTPARPAQLAAQKVSALYRDLSSAMFDHRYTLNP
jgi:hypothetical protein